MDVLMLSYRGEALREFPLRSTPLEVGRGAGCDIVVHDPALRDRHLLVTAQKGAVFVYELDGANAAPMPMGTGQMIPLGRHHALSRLPVVPTRELRIDVATEPIASDRGAGPQLSVVIGRGHEARRVALGARPLTIGSGTESDLRLSDRTVSARHCRLEPCADGLRVRDLGSRNGTLLDGVLVSLARVDAGSVLRLGRTDLRLVARGRRGDARASGLIGESSAMHGVLEQVERCSRNSYSTLITGESGTGKELIARAVHDRSAVAAGPYVAVNCGGMSTSLIESELFGHEKGAFTGAGGARRGVFEQADGGTLFLDEIGELPMALQKRFLRVLENWEVRRLGSERSIRVQVRVVAATHRDLRVMVADGSFRQDLYYRIAQLGIRVPPLRDRLDDVPSLATHFLAACAEELGTKHFSEAALERLSAHHWPGNVRELLNAVRRAAVACPSVVISVDDVVQVLEDMGATHDLDAERLRAIVNTHRGNLTAAARALGIPRTTLRYRLKPRRRANRDEPSTG